MGVNNGKFFNVTATRKYFYNIDTAFENYKELAGYHQEVQDELVSTESWQGADATKTIIKDTEETLLADIIAL